MEAAMTERELDNIPRIDKVGYLYETLGWIDDGATFEEIREAQIEYRKALDRDSFVDKRSGASSMRLLQKRANGERYWTNTRATVSELMRLGLVVPEPVPSRKEQLAAYRARRYQLTSEGAQFVALMAQDFWVFQDRFAQAFVLSHSLSRQLLDMLAHRELFIPRLGTDDLRGHIRSWPLVPPLLALVEDVCARIHAAGGPEIAPDRLLLEFEPGMKKLWGKRDRTLKNHDFNKSMVKAINDQLLRAMAALHRIPLNVIDFRAVVSLLAGLCALDSSHCLLGRTGWTIWSTSHAAPPGRLHEGQSPAAEALAGPPWFSRRTLTEAVLQDEIIQGVLSTSNREGGFALIHEVRAHVCHKHGIHARLFNQLLRKMHRGEIRHPAYSIYLDRGGYTHLPPSELPFLSDGRDFYLITFIPSQEANHGARQQIHS
jgi:hypothetical protein